MMTALPETSSTTNKKMDKHKSRRRIAREFVLQGIYQWKVAGGTAAFIEQQLRESDEFKHVDEKHFFTSTAGRIGGCRSARQIYSTLFGPSFE